jgi:hypothetical protein
MSTARTLTKALEGVPAPVARRPERPIPHRRTAPGAIL